ncbi:hypothetical protein [Gracilibacillus kekensis]|uniref:Uncharacterized protein n=1 Tax=Gracilibacillus kekensis TaxID=1027249 RepID=A0A1M7QTI2_9BACI|nr:hypothetical protein [Gracilibacillus kekensis]SHN34703.1 hypothetical protein SAMN05216179_3530 [Gracilibacillus kekensis]
MKSSILNPLMFSINRKLKSNVRINYPVNFFGHQLCKQLHEMNDQ